MAHCDAESYERCSSHHPCVRLEPIRRTVGIHAALHFCGDSPETTWGCSYKNLSRTVVRFRGYDELERGNDGLNEYRDLKPAALVIAERLA